MKTPEEVKKGLKNLHDMFRFAQPFREKVEHAIEYISALESRVADLEAKVPKWVNVEDGCPECNESKRVLVCDEDGYVYITKENA